MLKKTISLLLVASIIAVFAVSLTVSAATTFGSCGASMSWRVEKGVLSLTGSGEMLDYGKTNRAPWYEIRSSITSIAIERNITTIGNYSFYGCSKVASITIPETVVSIGNSAFESCKTLEKVTLPGGLKTIGSSAFKDCTSLSAIGIPTGVNSIGSDAFSGCVDIESVVLSRTIKTIEPRTFKGCIMIKSIIVPDMVTKIGEEAFADCSYLHSVSIGKGVTEIATGAFSGCTKLATVNYSKSTSDWNAITIGANNESVKNAHLVTNSVQAVDDATIMVYLNGEKLSFDQPPVIINGRTLVPLRAIFEALGAKVMWDDATKTVTATRGYTIVSLEIGKNYITIDGMAKELDVPAQIINSRTMVPVRAISEAFGCQVGWDAGTQTVLISEK